MLGKVQSRTAPGGIREMISVALPMVVSFSCDTLMTFTDRLFLSRCSVEWMSAAMAGGVTVFMLMSFVLGLVGYNTALVAQSLGAGKKLQCPLFITQGLWIIILAYPLIQVIGPIILRIFELSGISAGQMDAQVVYFQILLPGTIFAMFRHGLSAFFSGIGRTRVVMIASLVTMLVNMITNYILIFGKFGFPIMGIKGAALGTVFGSMCGVFFLLAVYFSKSLRQEFSIVGSLRFDAPVMKKLLQFGSPTGVEMFLNLLAFNLLIMAFHTAGSISATAATIVFNWDMVSFVPLLGVQIGVTSLVGRYMGAEDIQSAQTAVNSGLKLGLTYSALVLAGFALFPEVLVDVFRPGSGFEAAFLSARSLAVRMLRLATLYVLIHALVAVFLGALRGAGDTFWTMIFSVLMHWTLVIVLFLSLRIFGFSPLLSWGIMIGAFMSIAWVVVARYFEGKWKKLRLVSSDISGKDLTQPVYIDDFHEWRDL